MDFQILMVKLKAKEIHLSFSSLKQFARSPEHFVRYKLQKFIPTPAMVFGSLVDCLLFEEEKFNNRFFLGKTIPTSENQKLFCNYIFNDINEKKIKFKKGEEIKIDSEIIESAFLGAYKKGNAFDVYSKLATYIEATLSGKNMVTQNDFDTATKMKEKLFKNKAGARLVNSISEVQKKIEFEYLGWKIIGYIDAVGDDLICDLKTTDAEPKKVERFIFQNKTYVQLAIYNYGLENKRKYFKVLALDKNMNISIQQLSNDYILYGLKEFKNWIKDFNRCIMLNKFSYNYDFFGRHKGEYLINKPLYASDLMEIYDED